MKYYYTDPLAAAWMAKHFEMEFWGCERKISKDLILACINDPFCPGWEIHPDSLHLLEPNKGDEYKLPRYKSGKITKYEVGYYTGLRKERGCQLHGDRIGDEYYFSDLLNGHAQPRIVRDSVAERRNIKDFFMQLGFPEKRNGVAFMWPEWES